MYTKDSSMTNIVYALNEDNLTIEMLSRQMSLRNGELSRVLKFAGFIYKNRKWIASNDSHSLLDTTFRQLQIQSSNTKSNNHHKGNKNRAIDNIKSNRDHKSNHSNMALPFTQIEIDTLKQLAQSHIQKQSILNEIDTHLSQNTIESLLKRLQGFQNKKTDRKTFVINKDLIERLNAFCEIHRLKKSDVMSLALIDLLNKYK